MKSNKNFLNKLLISLQKNVTIFLFFILPKKVTNVFISLSILTLIFSIRKQINVNSYLDIDKFNYIMKSSFDNSILLLPNYTLSWFWTEEFLNSKIVFDDKTITIRNAIKDDNILYNHLRSILTVFLNNIPSVLKFKLNLNKNKESIIFKHSIMNMLIRV